MTLPTFKGGDYLKDVSEKYKNIIVSDIIEDEISGSIIVNGEAEPLSMSDLVSLKISRKGSTGQDLQIGAVTAQEITLEKFYEEPDYKKYNNALIGLIYKVKNPDDNDFETCSLNAFDASSTERKSQTIVIKGYDFMLRFEKKFAEPDSQSHTLFWWIQKACTVCDVELGMAESEFNALTNVQTVGAVSIKSGGIFSTWRDVLHYIAQLIGGYAFIRGASLYFAEFKAENAVLSIPQGLIDDGDKVSDSVIKYTTITAQRGDTLFSATTGETGRTYELGELPLLSEFSGDGIYETVLQNILANLSGISYTPFEIKWTGDPAIETGDFVQAGDIVSPIISADWDFDAMETLKSTASESDTVATATSSSNSSESKQIAQVNMLLKNYATKKYVDEQTGLKIIDYISKLKFTASGFITTASDGSNNVFVVNKDSGGKITSIKNTTLNQTLEVEYGE